MDSDLALTGCSGSSKHSADSVTRRTALAFFSAAVPLDCKPRCGGGFRQLFRSHPSPFSLSTIGGRLGEAGSRRFTLFSSGRESSSLVNRTCGRCRGGQSGSAVIPPLGRRKLTGPMRASSSAIISTKVAFYALSLLQLYKSSRI